MWPHGLTRENFMNRIFIWKPEQNLPIFAAESISKQGLTVRKMLLCVWWDHATEFTSLRAYFNLNVKCQWLDHMKEVIVQNRPTLTNNGMMFHQHNEKQTHQKCLIRKPESLVDWSLCIHLIVWTSYQLITNCSCIWRKIWLVKNYPQDKSVKIDCPNCFEYRNKDFYKRGLMTLLENGKRLSRKSVLIWHKLDNPNYGE